MIARINVGDTIKWADAWGSGPTLEAKVENIEKTEYSHQKDGVSVSNLDIYSENGIIDADNGKWLYHYQLREINGVKIDVTKIHHTMMLTAKTRL